MKGNSVMRRFRLSTVFLFLAVPFLMVSLGNCSQLSAEEKKAKHYERGMAYFEEGKYQEALNSLEIQLI